MGLSSHASDKEKIKFRQGFIEFYKQVGDVTLTCKTFKISRPTFYKWYKRYDPNNLDTLRDESKAPKSRKKKQIEQDPDKPQEKDILQHTQQEPSPVMPTIKPSVPQIRTSPTISTGLSPFHRAVHSIKDDEPQKPQQKPAVLSSHPLMEPTPQSTQTKQAPATQPTQTETFQTKTVGAPTVASLLRDRGVKSIETQKHSSPFHTGTPQVQSTKQKTPDIQPIRTTTKTQHTQPSPSAMKPLQTKQEIDKKDYAQENKQQTPGTLQSFFVRIQKNFTKGAKLNKRIFLIVGGFFILGLVIVIPYRIFSRMQNSTNSPIAGTNTEEYIERVSKFMELPKDEEPTIATVSDLEKLKGQPFFAEAKQGDVVLIYDRAAKIILYDPVANKIINAASTNIDTPSPTKSAENTRVVNIALYNGTTVTGLTRTVEDDLTEKMEGINVILRDNASKNTYTNTLIIDLTGNNQARAESIATALNGDVSTLPEDETEPSIGGDNAIDILAIIGSDYVE